MARTGVVSWTGQAETGRKRAAMFRNFVALSALLWPPRMLTGGCRSRMGRKYVQSCALRHPASARQKERHSGAGAAITTTGPPHGCSASPAAHTRRYQDSLRTSRREHTAQHSTEEEGLVLPAMSSPEPLWAAPSMARNPERSRHEAAAQPRRRNPSESESKIGASLPSRTPSTPALTAAQNSRP